MSLELSCLIYHNLRYMLMNNHNKKNMLWFVVGKTRIYELKLQYRTRITYFNVRSWAKLMFKIEIGFTCFDKSEGIGCETGSANKALCSAGSPIATWSVHRGGRLKSRIALVLTYWLLSCLTKNLFVSEYFEFREFSNCFPREVASLLQSFNELRREQTIKKLQINCQNFWLS